LSDEISTLVGNICARIHPWVSEDSWGKLFKPSEINTEVLKEAVELSWQNRHELVFLTLFLTSKDNDFLILPNNGTMNKPLIRESPYGERSEPGIVEGSIVRRFFCIIFLGVFILSY